MRLCMPAWHQVVYMHLHLSSSARKEVVIASHTPSQPSGCTRRSRLDRRFQFLPPPCTSPTAYSQTQADPARPGPLPGCGRGRDWRRLACVAVGAATQGLVSSTGGCRCALLLRCAACAAFCARLHPAGTCCCAGLAAAVHCCCAAPSCRSLQHSKRYCPCLPLQHTQG